MKGEMSKMSEVLVVLVYWVIRKLGVTNEWLQD